MSAPMKHSSTFWMERRIVSNAVLTMGREEAERVEREHIRENGYPTRFRLLAREHKGKRIVAGTVWFPKPGRRSVDHPCTNGIRLVAFSGDHVLVMNEMNWTRKDQRLRYVSLRTLVDAYEEGRKARGETWFPDRPIGEVIFESIFGEFRSFARSKQRKQTAGELPS